MMEEVLVNDKEESVVDEVVMKEDKIEENPDILTCAINYDDNHMLENNVTYPQEQQQQHVVIENPPPLIINNETHVNLPSTTVLSRKMWLKYYESTGWTKEFDEDSFNCLQGLQQTTNDNNINDNDDNKHNTWHTQQSIQQKTLLTINHRLNRTLSCLTHGVDWLTKSDNPPHGAAITNNSENNVSEDIITFVTNHKKNQLKVNDNNNNTDGNTSSKHLSSIESIELKLDALECLCMMLKEQKLITPNCVINLSFNSHTYPSSPPPVSPVDNNKKEYVANDNGINIDNNVEIIATIVTGEKDTTSGDLNGHHVELQKDNVMTNNVKTNDNNRNEIKNAHNKIETDEDNETCIIQ